VRHDGSVITTAPAGVADPTAALGRRVVAAAIDIGIITLFAAAFWLLVSHRAPDDVVRRYGACSERDVCTEIGNRYVTGTPMVLLVIACAAYLFGVFVLQRGLTGRTLGTMLAGLVVVGEDGRPLGVGRALLRSAAGVVDYLPCCLPIVGMVSMYSSRGHRRVGDLAAESYVVTADHFGIPVSLPDADAPEPSPEPPARIPDRPPVPSAGAPPVAMPAPAPAPAPEPPGAPAGWASPAVPPGAPSGPVWDEHRRAYLQWDPYRNAWLQFDQASGTWLSYDESSGHWGPLDT
jgi:uncharacterized RDD family membrane protein YckC